MTKLSYLFLIIILKFLISFSIIFLSKRYFFEQETNMVNQFYYYTNARTKDKHMLNTKARIPTFYVQIGIVEAQIYEKNFQLTFSHEPKKAHERCSFYFLREQLQLQVEAHAHLLEETTHICLSLQPEGDDHTCEQ